MMSIMGDGYLMQLCCLPNWRLKILLNWSIIAVSTIFEEIVIFGCLRKQRTLINSPVFTKSIFTIVIKMLQILFLYPVRPKRRQKIWLSKIQFIYSSPEHYKSIRILKLLWNSRRRDCLKGTNKPNGMINKIYFETVGSIMGQF